MSRSHPIPARKQPPSTRINLGARCTWCRKSKCWSSLARNRWANFPQRPMTGAFHGITQGPAGRPWQPGTDGWKKFLPGFSKWWIHVNLNPISISLMLRSYMKWIDMGNFRMIFWMPPGLQLEETSQKSGPRCGLGVCTTSQCVISQRFLTRCRRSQNLTMTQTIWLVVSTPLKNMNVNWDDYSQHIIWENKQCPKPPTSNVLMFKWLLLQSLTESQYKFHGHMPNVHHIFRNGSIPIVMALKKTVLSTKRSPHLWFMKTKQRNHQLYKVVPQFVNAKLVNISPMNMVLVGDTSIVLLGFTNPRSHHWGAPPCVYIYICININTYILII